MAEAFDYRRHYLSEVDSERIFRERIVPQQLNGAATVEHPTAVFVAGQPGAGKTDLAAAVGESLEVVEGSVCINSDTYKPYHPQWPTLLAQDDTTAAPYTAADGRRWMAKAETYAVEQRLNIILETTMRDPEVFEIPIERLRRAGYRIEVAVMAVPEAVSRLGIIARYTQQVRDSGAGRLTEVSNHDACYAGVQSTVARLDLDPQIDVLSVWRRGPELLYGNVRGDGPEWAAPAAAATTLANERTRPRTYPEAIQLLGSLARLRDEVPPALTDDVRAVELLARPLLPPGAEAVATAAVSYPEILNPLQRKLIAAERVPPPTSGHGSDQGLGR